MSGYDFNRPFIVQADMGTYLALDAQTARNYGKTVKATELSNVEYQTRFGRFERENNMKPPPSCGRIFMGYLVVRQVGTDQQYETWMPDDVFDELYEPQA